MMQTLSGVTVDDGREVVAVVPPGKYPAGSSINVETRHVVDKPRNLDWERAAILPFLVSNGGDEWRSRCGSLQSRASYVYRCLRVVLQVLFASLANRDYDI